MRGVEMAKKAKRKYVRKTAGRPPAALKDDLATVTVAVSDPGTGYIPGSVQVGALTQKQGTNLRRMYNGLRESHALVPTTSRPDGKHVDGYNDVIRYLLENVV